MDSGDCSPPPGSLCVDQTVIYDLYCPCFCPYELRGRRWNGVTFNKGIRWADRHLTIPAPHRSVRAAFPHTALHNNIYSFRISWHISSALPVDNISAFLWTLPVYSSSCCSFGSEPWTAFLLPTVWSCLSSFRWSWHHNTCSALSVSDWAFPSVSLVSGLD